MLVLLAMLAIAAPAVAQVSTAADALRTDHVYVDPQAEQAGAIDAAALRSEIGDKPIYIAVLPESAVQGSPGRTLFALRQDVGEEGRYALVVGDELRTLPATDAPAGDLQPALMKFAQAEADSSGGGGAILGVIVIGLLIAVAAGGAVLLVNRRRQRAGDGKSEARAPDVNEDFVRLGDGIRAIELDVTLTDNPAAKADYDRAVDAYDRANSHHRKGDEPAADRALDEGLAAIGSAQERLAGRKR
jgi:hypothetical protein